MIGGRGRRGAVPLERDRLAGRGSLTGSTSLTRGRSGRAQGTELEFGLDARGAAWTVLAERPTRARVARGSTDGVRSQAGGGRKMGASWPLGWSVGSSIVRPNGRAAPRDTAACKDTHWSEPSDTGEAVDTGKGTRLEQPSPEQGARRLRPAGSRGPWVGSPVIGEGELPMMRASRWLKVRSRSAFEKTRWLQPAQAVRAVPRP